MTASNTAKRPHNEGSLLAAAGAEMRAGAAVFMGPLVAAGKTVIKSLETRQERFSTRAIAGHVLADRSARKK